VAGLFHEPPELGDGHQVVVHPEAVHADFVDRPLVGVEVGGSHAERAARDPRHVTRRLRTERVGGMGG
jgi:hypothetical protein